MEIKLSSEEERLKRSQTRKRNLYAREIHDPGEHRGAFHMKVIDGRKQEYKRVKMKVNLIDDNEEDN